MRRWGAVVMLAALVAGAAQARPTATEPPAERQKALLYLLRQDCGSCHGLTLKGGLGPALLPQNLTGKSDDMLVDTILHGRPGTPMPPWGFALSPDEVRWLVDMLRHGRTDG